MHRSSDKALLAALDRVGAQCVRVQEMSEQQRHEPRGKGGETPLDSGVLCAWVFVSTATELIRRGVLPPDWLDDVLDTTPESC
jgi:hypothetical protein